MSEEILVNTFDQAENSVSENLSETQGSANVQNNSQDLILGKFKDVQDLENAYKNMQTQQGQQSKELGELRKKVQIYDQQQKNILEQNERYNKASEYFKNIVPQYNKEEYFQNPEFSSLYKEAFNALGTSLDSPKFISLLDNYVQSRINLYEKTKSAKAENEASKNQIQFSKSNSKYTQSQLPNLDTLSDTEIDALVAKHI